MGLSPAVPSGSKANKRIPHGTEGDIAIVVISRVMGTHGARSSASPSSASKAGRPTRRSSRSPPTRPIATTREVWRIWLAPVHVKSLRAHALRSLISARKKLVGQRVTLENQIRGLAVVFGVRLPRALTTAFIDQALKASEGVAGLSAAMRGLSAARVAVMTAVAAIDADIRRMTRASAACRRLMTIPGVGQLTALALSRQSTIPPASADPETSAPIWAWSPGGISRGRSITPAASPNAAIGGCEPSCTWPPMSC